MPRYTLDMDEKFDSNLTRLAEGGSKADVIRKAVAVYSLLKSEVPSHSSKKQVAIRDEHGAVLKDVVLP